MRNSSPPAVPSLRVAIVYDGTALDEGMIFDAQLGETVAVETILDVVVEMEQALTKRGHVVQRLALPGADPVGLLRALADVQADVLFNFVESLRGVAELEACVRGAMAVRGIPTTGASAEGLAYCLNKPRARALLTAAGVPVPTACVVTSAPETQTLAFLAQVTHPVLVKPSAQDASHGIDVKSVCRTTEESLARASWLVERGLGPALVEQYVEGREYNVSMVELVKGTERTLRTLPIAEITFDGYPAGMPKILTYAAKWEKDAPEYKGSASVEAKDMSPELREKLTRYANMTFRALLMCGYGRVDFRVDAQGNPYAIDANPNPDFSTGAGFHLAGERAGYAYEDLVELVVRAALP
jgi:D-alanine-D-alanine ligase